MLVGLPDLRGRLQLARNRSLWSRIHTRLGLGDAVPADTAEYVHHLLRLAGARRELLDSDALALLHEGSGGHLRDVDRLATAALRQAAARGLRVVDRVALADVLGREQTR